MSDYRDVKEIFNDAHDLGEWLYDHVLHHVDEHFQPGSGEVGEAYLHFINEHGDPMTFFENHHPVDHSHDYQHEYHHSDHCDYDY